MAFRFLDPNPVHFNNDGTVCAGGELRFYVNESTTPTNAGEGPDLSPSLGATVTLDASGRAEDDVWLAPGAYRARLYNADGELQWSRDHIQDGDTSGVEVPDPADGDEDQVLATDGVDYYFKDVREVPDPTGHSGKYLGTDGDVPAWTAFPEAVEYDDDNLPGGITSTETSSGSFTIGNTRVQWGSDTAPTAASCLTTKAVTFGVAFSGTPYSVQVTPTSGGVTSDTPAARCSAQALSANTTGFTASLFAGAEDEGSGSTNITSTVAFSWLAIGPK